MTELRLRARDELSKLSAQLMASLKRYHPRLLGTYANHGALCSRTAEFYCRVLNNTDRHIRLDAHELSQNLQAAALNFGAETVEIEGASGSRFAAVLTLVAPYRAEQLDSKVFDGLLSSSFEFVLTPVGDRDGLRQGRRAAQDPVQQDQVHQRQRRADAGGGGRAHPAAGGQVLDVRARADPGRLRRLDQGAEPERQRRRHAARPEEHEHLARAGRGAHLHLLQHAAGQLQVRPHPGDADQQQELLQVLPHAQPSARQCQRQPVGCADRAIEDGGRRPVLLQLPREPQPAAGAGYPAGLRRGVGAALDRDDEDVAANDQRGCGRTEGAPQGTRQLQDHRPLGRRQDGAEAGAAAAGPQAGHGQRQAAEDLQLRQGLRRGDLHPRHGRALLPHRRRRADRHEPVLHGADRREHLGDPEHHELERAVRWQVRHDAQGRGRPAAQHPAGL